MMSVLSARGGREVKLLVKKAGGPSVSHDSSRGCGPGQGAWDRPAQLPPRPWSAPAVPQCSEGAKLGLGCTRVPDGHV